MSVKNAEPSIETVLKKIHEEIFPLFRQAIYDDDVYFQNPNIRPCWEIYDCTRKECPVFGKTDVRCWQTTGTFCGGKIQGAFTEKFENCLQCDIFKVACPTIVEELGENLNNLLFLLRKEKFATREQSKKIEYLNKELLSSIENLDEKNREIQELVITDKLTGLYNRHYLRTALGDEFHRCERGEYKFSLLMLDLDDFKSINDTYGHSQGDKILEGLGKILKENARKCDRSFRYGGEEFVVILPDTDITVAWVMAERLRKKFEETSFTFKAEDGSEQIISRTVSIGISSYEEGTTSDRLVKQADDAMYHAKMEGKNKVVRYGID